MPSYQERSRLIKQLSEQAYFDALKREDAQKKDVRVGGIDGRTGRYQVLSADGGLSSNGVSTSNAAPPSDGFVRGLQSPNVNAISLGWRKYNAVDFVRVEEEIEAVVESPIFVSYDILYFLIFSGNNVIGTPKSTINVFTPMSGLPIDSQNGVVYTINTETGLLDSQSGSLVLELSGDTENNTINISESTATQEFVYDPSDPDNIIQINRIGVILSGSYIDHPLVPPSFSVSLWSIGIKLNLASQKFIKEWDVIGDPEDENAVRPIEALDNEIDRLDELLNVDKRAVVLTKLIADKGLSAIKDTTITTIENQRIILGNPFFAQDLEFVLGKVFDDAFPDVPAELPPIDPSEEFFNLSSNLDTLVTRLNTFNANPDRIAVSNAERSARECTKEGERSVKLQAFIDANNFTNYITQVRSRPSSGLYAYNYRRVNWNTIPSSPLDLSFEVEGVPYEFDFGVYLIRQGDFYYVGTDGDMGGIPFGRPAYNADFKWRKRGNTEWFSL